MTVDQWAVGSQLKALQGRCMLDIAEGILMGLRRCDTDAAFQETVARRSHSFRTGLHHGFGARRTRRRHCRFQPPARAGPSGGARCLGLATQRLTDGPSSRSEQALMPIGFVLPFVQRSAQNGRAQRVCRRYPWKALVASLEAALRLYKHRDGTLVRNAKYLYQRTGGSISSLSHLIRVTAITAILGGEDAITREALDAAIIDHASETKTSHPTKAATG